MSLLNTSHTQRKHKNNIQKELGKNTYLVNSAFKNVKAVLCHDPQRKTLKCSLGVSGPNFHLFASHICCLQALDEIPLHYHKVHSKFPDLHCFQIEKINQSFFSKLISILNTIQIKISIFIIFLIISIIIIIIIIIILLGRFK